MGRALASVDAKKVNGAWQQGQSLVLRLSSSSELVTVASHADWPAAIKRAFERHPPGSDRRRQRVPSSAPAERKAPS